MWNFYCHLEAEIKIFVLFIQTTFIKDVVLNQYDTVRMRTFGFPSAHVNYKIVFHCLQLLQTASLGTKGMHSLQITKPQ